MADLHVVFDNPVIPSNTGNAIRLAAVTGAHLQSAEPLRLNLADKPVLFTPTSTTKTAIFYSLAQNPPVCQLRHLRTRG